MPPAPGITRNRLAAEQSPYLLRHAGNPVDWFPWGEEAFLKAAHEDKPVFLSIGYSTCHWCHVMERESFENNDLAALLNDNFVSIKVDREEHPDIDHMYMNALHAMGFGGGWPLSVFCTPDKKPFFGGTYFPPTSRNGQYGFGSILKMVAGGWKSNRQELMAHAGNIVASLNRTPASTHTHLGEATLRHAVAELSHHYDPIFGGFSESPKFPMAHVLSFLLRCWYRFQDKSTLDMVTHTLDHIAAGGIFDHLSGGFHRYSTERTWLIPHFEKMLYDQALLATTFTEAFQITGKEAYARVVRETLAYLTGCMRHPSGGFYSAEDADSDGKEGMFYLWNKEEIIDILGAEDGELYCKIFGVTDGGNFEGTNILTVRVLPEQFAEKSGIDYDVLLRQLDRCRMILRAVRCLRTRPFRDEKILTDWNGLTISAFSYASRVLAEPMYAKTASAAARFILSAMRDDNGFLYRRWYDGKAAVPGVLTDYAFFCNGLLDLYEATFDAQWLIEARSLSTQMYQRFQDASKSGFLMTPRDGEQCIVDFREVSDGALPSGNAVALMALTRLAHITDDRQLQELIDRTFREFSSEIADTPAGYPGMLTALDYRLGPRREIVIAAGGNDGEESLFVNEICKCFAPRTFVTLHRDGEAGLLLGTVAPFVKNMHSTDGKATLHVCENNKCRLPATTVDEARKLFENLNP